MKKFNYLIFIFTIMKKSNYLIFIFKIINEII